MKKLCSECGKHPATFRHNGKVKIDKDHDMCQQCFRGYREKQKEK